jgi:hypothetical protein
LAPEIYEEAFQFQEAILDSYVSRCVGPKPTGNMQLEQWKEDMFVAKEKLTNIFDDEETIKGLERRLRKLNNENHNKGSDICAA